MSKPSDPVIPIVSVLMPVYNCGRHLAEAIGSVLRQTFTAFELVIVDDGSTDDSRQVINSFPDQRIVLVANQANIGLVKTLNKGIATCRGKYIARIDGDDICHPRRLEKQVAFMEGNPQIGLCGTWAELIDNNGRQTGKAKNLTRNKELQINLLFSVPFYHPSVMVRATLLKENPYDENFPQAQDYELWTRLAEKTQLANIPEYLLSYRWHGDNISVKNKAGQQERKREILRRQLCKLGIDPTGKELELHQETFGYPMPQKDTVITDPRELAAWYKKILAANKQTGKYSKPILRAYLWSRWAVFCRLNGKAQNVFFPRFMSLNPVVLFYLVKFVSHFAGKSGNRRQG